MPLTSPFSGFVPSSGLGGFVWALPPTRLTALLPIPGEASRGLDDGLCNVVQVVVRCHPIRLLRLPAWWEVDPGKLPATFQHAHGIHTVGSRLHQ